MLRENKKILQYGFGALALVSGFLLLVFLLWPYSELQLLFQKFNAEKDWLLHWNSFTGTYGFSENIYTVAKIGLALICGGSLLAFYRLQKSESISNASSFKTVAFFTQKLKRVWVELPLPEKWIVGLTLVGLLAVRLYLLLSLRIGMDEAASLILFLDKGLAGILFYYPLPNNHIFYNLLCLPLRHLFTDPYWVMQLPAFLLSMAGSVVLYLALRSVFPFLVAYFGFTGFSFSFLALYYATHGRGYFLLALCSAFAAIALYKIYERKGDQYWLIFLLCTIIGFATIPVFLYPFASLLVFGFAAFVYSRNRQALVKLFLVTFFAGIATVLLYVPALMASGPHLLFKNDYVQRQPAEVFFQNSWLKLVNLQGTIIGQESIGFYLWFLAVLGLLFLLVFRKYFNAVWQRSAVKPAAVLLILTLSILPWVLLVLQQVAPPDRVFLFKSFFDFLVIGAALYLFSFPVLQRFPRIGYILLPAYLLVFGVYETHKLIRMENSVGQIDKGFDARLQAIRETGARTIFANDIYYSANLRYEYFKNEAPGFIIDEYRFVPSRHYNLLILNRSFAKPPGLILSGFGLYFQDTYVQIYLRKK
jgi:hypothetical protein